MKTSDKKQKLIIENFLSSNDLFAICVAIIQPSYFVPEYRKVVNFIKKYYEEHNAVPPFNIVNAEFDCNFGEQKVTTDTFDHLSKEIESYCQQEALIEAIQAAFEFIEKEEYDAISPLISDALAVSLEKDMGIELYEESVDIIYENLMKAKDTQKTISTGIKDLDDKLGGGLARRQTTLFSANSGGGKSVMLANLGKNYARQGYNVVYFSLELPEEMVNVRTATIATGVSIRVWDQKMQEIANEIIKQKEEGAGSYLLKRIPGGSNCNYIRAFLKQYEIKFDRKPDVIIIDYLDIMSPNAGKGSKGVSVIDKEISEEMAELAFDYNAIMLSASQQNREALRMTSPDQAVVAGGLSKVNTVDNYISIVMTDAMRLQGQMNLFFLKTRSSDAVGKNVFVKYNPHNLQITDGDGDWSNTMPTAEESVKMSSDVINENINLPGTAEMKATLSKSYEKHMELERKMENDKAQDIKKPLNTIKNDNSGDSLLDLIDDVNGLSLGN